MRQPKATVYRCLQTMKTLGCMRQESDTERYGLTTRMDGLGARSRRYTDLVELAQPHMQRLSRANGETVTWGRCSSKAARA
jgi:IclR family KDG regulon transcriptional repressor